MIIFEQILISVTAIIAGIVIGNLASTLYVPLLEMVYSSAEQIPPFEVISSRADYLKIYAVVGTMLLSGFAVLSIKIYNVQIARALKLGED